MSLTQRGSHIEIISGPTLEQIRPVFEGDCQETPAEFTTPRPNWMTRVYVAGPMRGVPGFNFPAFNDAAKRLREAGFVVFNPAERDVKHGFTGVGMTGNEDLNNGTTRFSLREALNDDLSWIAQNADVICLLDGWENSAGTRAEMSLAAAVGLHAGYSYEILHDQELPLASEWLRWAAEDEASGQFDVPVAAKSVAAYDNMESFAVDCDDHDHTDVGERIEYVISDEVRTTSATGGEKGVKPAAFDLIPVFPLTEVAKLYDFGARKYNRDNWRKGYEFHKSYASLMRHATQFWGGENDDAETGLSHMTSVVFHAFALMQGLRDHPEMDDRPGMDTDEDLNIVRKVSA